MIVLFGYQAPRTLGTPNQIDIYMDLNLKLLVLGIITLCKNIFLNPLYPLTNESHFQNCVLLLKVKRYKKEEEEK